MKINKSSVFGLIICVLTICAVILRFRLNIGYMNARGEQINITANDIRYCMAWINSISVGVCIVSIMFSTSDKLNVKFEKNGGEASELLENNSISNIMMAEIIFLVAIIMVLFLVVIDKPSDFKNDICGIISLGGALGVDFITTVIAEIFYNDN